MDAKKLFLKQDRLKTGWRILIFLAISFSLLYYLTYLLWDDLLIRYIIIFWLLLLISFFSARYLDKRPFGTIGYLFHPRWLKEYLQGILLGILIVSILFFFEFLSGYIDVKINLITISLLLDIFVFLMLTTIFQSAFEELFFRGYMYQNLIELSNPIIATLAISCLFGLGHLLTPNSRWIVALNLSVFGFMHAVAYLKTRSLFLPSGLHFSWNFFMRDIYSLPVSGVESSASLLTTRVSGPGWITGGDYGPETGVPAFLLMIATTLFIYYSGRMKTAPEMKKLWQQYDRKYESK